jgi:hypothetical protein
LTSDFLNWFEHCKSTKEMTRCHQGGQSLVKLSNDSLISIYKSKLFIKWIIKNKKKSRSVNQIFLILDSFFLWGMEIVYHYHRLF